ncbi:MAG: hypothetical protein P9X24_01270, partial [Candidatus Hatepunaea meridiana]|nr:hypothetical protein [Candidatus Hatepunaea meridiana]
TIALLGVLDKPQEGCSVLGRCPTDGIVGIVVKKIVSVIYRIGFDHTPLVADGLFLAIGRASEIAYGVFEVRGSDIVHLLEPPVLHELVVPTVQLFGSEVKAFCSESSAVRDVFASTPACRRIALTSQVAKKYNAYSCCSGSKLWIYSALRFH